MSETPRELDVNAVLRAAQSVTDPVVVQIVGAKDDEEALRIEQAHLVQTDNGLRPGDPKEQPK